jgi:hypothetical protein
MHIVTPHTTTYDELSETIMLLLMLWVCATTIHREELLLEMCININKVRKKANNIR